MIRVMHIEKYVDQFIGTEGKLDYLRSQKKKKKKKKKKKEARMLILIYEWIVNLPIYFTRLVWSSMHESVGCNNTVFTD